MSICCKAIRQIYYNAGSGYTVASYMTNEDLPEEVKNKRMEIMEYFRHLERTSDKRRPGCGTDGRLETHKIWNAV